METSFNYAAEINICERSKLDRETKNTDIVEELILQRQNLKDQRKFEEAT